MSASANLLSELREKFPQRVFEPFGLCTAIPNGSYKREWTEQLQELGCKVYTQAWDGQIFHFVREKSQTHMLGNELKHDSDVARHSLWTDDELAQLKQLRSENIGLTTIAKKLNRSESAVRRRIIKMKCDEKDAASDVQVSVLNIGNRAHQKQEDSTVKEFLACVSELYPRYPHVCSMLLKEASSKVLEQNV